MGGLMLTRFLSARQERRRRLSHRQIRRDFTSVDKPKGLKCQHYDDSQGHRGIGSGPCLPEDVIRHIHTLMPLQDAARAACISHTFLRSWRCYPNLTFTLETLGLDKSTATDQDGLSRHFINKVEHILHNHAGICVKALKLEVFHGSNVDLCYIDSWLHIAVTPGVEELTLVLPHDSKARYNFPCSLLFGRGGNSVQYLDLTDCTFRPTVDLGYMRRLTQLHLCYVWITGDELQLLLSKSLALERLRISCCHEIIHVTVPCLLQRLNSLQVMECSKVRAIEINAPNLSSFHFDGRFVRMSFANPMLVKDVEITCIYQSNVVSSARTKFLSLWPNVEALTVHSPTEIENTPTVPGKFLHLKYLHVGFAANWLAFSPAYDYLSLVSFLDASPLLESFILSVSQHCMRHVSVFEEAGNFHPRQMSQRHCHEKLKTVKLSGFCAARSMVELTYHVLENAPSLERLTLDTTGGGPGRCCLGESGECTMLWCEVEKAQRAVLAARRYVMEKVPPTVELIVVEPCGECHALELDPDRLLLDDYNDV